MRFISATFVGMLPAAAQVMRLAPPLTFSGCAACPRQVTSLTPSPAPGQVARLLFVLIYGFSALGMQLFGGLINRSPHRPQAAQLGNSSFGEADYSNA